MAYEAQRAGVSPREYLNWLASQPEEVREIWMEAAGSVRADDDGRLQRRIEGQLPFEQVNPSTGGTVPRWIVTPRSLTELHVYLEQAGITYG